MASNMLEIINTGPELRVIQGGVVLGAYTIGMVSMFDVETARRAGITYWPQLEQAADAGVGVHYLPATQGGANDE